MFPRSHPLVYWLSQEAMFNQKTPEPLYQRWRPCVTHGCFLSTSPSGLFRMIAFITFIHLKLIILDMWKTCHHLSLFYIVPSNLGAILFWKTIRRLALALFVVVASRDSSCVPLLRLRCRLLGRFRVFWWWQILPNVLRWLQLSEVCFLTRIIRTFNVYIYICVCIFILTQYIYLLSFFNLLYGY